MNRILKTLTSRNERGAFAFAAGCLLILFPLLTAANAAEPAKQSSFQQRLEEARGDYDVLRGKGSACGGGPLAPLEGFPGVYSLGPNLFIRGVDEGEKVYPEDLDCETRETSVSEKNTLTVTTRTVCPGQSEKTIVSKFRFLRNRIHYEDPDSICTFKKTTKSTERTPQSSASPSAVTSKSVKAKK